MASASDSSSPQPVSSLLQWSGKGACWAPEVRRGSAVSMSSALQFELLDLRHFSAGSLRPLLDEESRVWSERLHWDYRGSADLLLQYLDSRVLPRLRGRRERAHRRLRLLRLRGT